MGEPYVAPVVVEEAAPATNELVCPAWDHTVDAICSGNTDLSAAEIDNEIVEYGYARTGLLYLGGTDTAQVDGKICECKAAKV